MTRARRVHERPVSRRGRSRGVGRGRAIGSRPGRTGFLAVALLAVVVVAVVGAHQAHAYSPAVNYALHCQGCHLADGRATPGLVPALDGTLGRMVRVPEGRTYLTRQPNVVAAQLGDADTAALLNWMLARFAASELDPGFAPITVAEVVAGRRAPLVDVDTARREVLRRIGEAP